MTKRTQNFRRPGGLAAFVPAHPHAAIPRERSARILAGLLISAALPLFASAGALAQGSSSLFAVGEGKSRAQARPAAPAPATPRPGPAASDGGQAAQKSLPPKPVARKTTPPRAAAKRSSKAASAARRGSPVALNGRWQDSECIPLTGLTHRPALYVKRQYDFNDARRTWRLEADVYTSANCLGDRRLLTYAGQGTFAVTGKSRLASNAYDASFKIDRWTATPLSRDGVLTLLNGRCGSGDFAEGRPLDLSASGCATLGIRSIARAPAEVELVSVSNGKFFLGSRAFIPGLSDARPAQLSSYGLTRVH